MRNWLAYIISASLVPARANVWRSVTGNVFRFRTDGSVFAQYASGSTNQGRWWWVRPGEKLGYRLHGSATNFFLYLDQLGGATCQDRATGVTTRWSCLSEHRPQRPGETVLPWPR